MCGVEDPGKKNQTNDFIFSAEWAGPSCTSGQTLSLSIIDLIAWVSCRTTRSAHGSSLPRLLPCGVHAPSPVDCLMILQSDSPWLFFLTIGLILLGYLSFPTDDVEFFEFRLWLSPRPVPSTWCLCDCVFKSMSLFIWKCHPSVLSYLQRNHIQVLLSGLA